jgi:hypothetical protein
LIEASAQEQLDRAGAQIESTPSQPTGPQLGEGLDEGTRRYAPAAAVGHHRQVWAAAQHWPPHPGQRTGVLSQGGISAAVERGQASGRQESLNKIRTTTAASTDSTASKPSSPT